MFVPNPARRRNLAWRALGISMALHALLAIALCAIPSWRPIAPDTDTTEISICLFEGETAESLSTMIAPTKTDSTDAAQATEFIAVHGPTRPVVAAQAVTGIGHGATNGGDSPGTGTNGAGRFFPIGTPSESIVYVIDRSSSMGFHGAMERARSELIHSLESLPETTRFQVIIFNQTARLLLPARTGLLPATPENRRDVAAALEQTPPLGGTKHEHALPMALAFQPDVIFFLTDADDLTPDYVQEITTKNRGRSIIHTIELSAANRNRAAMPLQLLARYNRGTYLGINP